MFKLLMAATLVMLTTLTSAFAAHDPNRIVTTVDSVAKTFSCHAKAGQPSYTYKTTSKTTVRINGKRPRLSHLWDMGNFSEIKVGGTITVRYHLDSDDRIAERVVIYPKN